MFSGGVTEMSTACVVRASTSSAATLVVSPDGRKLTCQPVGALAVKE